MLREKTPAMWGGLFSGILERYDLYMDQNKNYIVRDKTDNIMQYG